MRICIMLSKRFPGPEYFNEKKIIYDSCDCALKEHFLTCMFSRKGYKGKRVPPDGLPLCVS